MKVTVAVLADYTNVTTEGKLNILGIFDHIRASAVPARHLEFKLVLRLEVALAEMGREHSIEVQCMDEDGDTLMGIEGGFIVQRPDGETATVLPVNHVLGIQNLKFPKFGTYTFSVFIDQDLKAAIDFRVIKVDQPPLMLPGT